MPSVPGTEDELVNSLCRFVTQPESYGYGKESPLQKAVRDHMRTMVKEMAGEVVASTPKVREVMHRLIQQSVEEALRDDAFLNKIVTDAVAKALVTRSTEDD